MTKRSTVKQPIPIGIAVTAIVLVIAIAAVIGWKVFGGSGSPAEGSKVTIDLNKVKEDMKHDKFGGH